VWHVTRVDLTQTFGLVILPPVCSTQSETVMWQVAPFRCTYPRLTRFTGLPRALGWFWVDLIEVFTTELLPELDSLTTKVMTARFCLGLTGYRLRLD
jgi:hypothetical protein